MVTDDVRTLGHHLRRQNQASTDVAQISAKLRLARTGQSFVALTTVGWACARTFAEFATLVEVVELWENA